VKTVNKNREKGLLKKGQSNQFSELVSFLTIVNPFLNWQLNEDSISGSTLLGTNVKVLVCGGLSN